MMFSAVRLSRPGVPSTLVLQLAVVRARAMEKVPATGLRRFMMLSMSLASTTGVSGRRLEMNRDAEETSGGSVRDSAPQMRTRAVGADDAAGLRPW